MPTTTYTDTTFSVSAVGSRTDAAGAAVVDYSAEEVRLPYALLDEGWLKPATRTSFQVTAQGTPNMSVKVGSGTARQDLYVVAGDTTGQGNYVARLDANTVTVPIAAADAAQPRTDEVWLVVLDNAYDATARALPRLAVRKGDLGGANPGPDSSWKASALLARVTVPAGAVTITAGNISDQRVHSVLRVPEVIVSEEFGYNDATLGELLDGKANSSHGHDPLGATMTGTSGTRGFARFWSDIGEAIGTNTDQVVGYYIAADDDPLVTWASEIPGDRFTLNASGIWAITPTLRYPGVSQAGERYASIRNGSTILSAVGGPAAPNVPYTLNPTWTGYLPSGTVIRVWSYQTSGVTLFIAPSEGWRNVNFALLRRTS